MADTSPHIAFFIPAVLADSPPHATSRHSCLEKLVARGDATRTALSGDAQLLALFGGNPANGSARAAVSHLVQHGDSDGDEWCILASPVHLLADHATLHFPPQHAVSLNDEESRALMAACQDHFAGEGWQFEYGDAQTWYLHVNKTIGITTTPLDDAVGKPLFEALPQGSDARIWRCWVNEAQMLFHNHPVNSARRGRGEPAINSLWFWGEGGLPVLSEQKFARVLGGDTYVQGLARLSGAEWAPSPLDISALDASDLQGALLVVLDQADVSAWDHRWFCALPGMLREKSLDSALLHFHNGYATKFTRSMLWRFWRRKHFSLMSRELAS